MRNGTTHQQKMRGTEMMRKRYLTNGYPPNVIQRAIQQAKKEPKQRSEDIRKKTFITLPFMNEKQARDIRKCLKKCELEHLLSVSFTSSNLTSLLRPKINSTCSLNCKYCKQAERGETCTKKFCVYKISCLLCNAFYIGETARTMKSRLKEHVTVNTSHVFQHLQSHGGEPVLESVSWTIVHNNLRAFDLRLAVESNEIRSLKPLLNVQGTNI